MRTSASAAGEEPLWLLAVPADAALAATVTSMVAELGVVARAETPRSSKSVRVVVLISSAAVRDPAWLDAVAHLAGARLIPVKVGDVDARVVPQALASLNWIPWLAENPHATVYQIFTAAQSDLERYRIGRSIESRAYAWMRGGQRDEDLIVSVRRAREAADLASGSGSPLMPFAQQSLVRARKLRRKQWSRWTRRAVSIAFTVSVVTLAVVSLRAEGRANIIATGATSLSGSSRPDLTAMKQASTLAYQLSKNDARSPDFRALASTLSVPWTQAIVGVQEDGALNDLAFVAGSSKVVTADGRGSITWWSTTTGNAIARYGYRLGPLYVITATADGSRVAAAGQSAAVVVDGNGNVVRQIPFSGASDLAFTRQGHEVVALLPNGSLAVADVDTGVVRTLPVPGKVLAVDALTDGTVRAIAWSGHDLFVLDGTTGSVVWSGNWSPPQYPIAAIGSDGAMAVEEADSRIWWSDPGQPLRSTGIRVSDALTALAVASDRAVIASGAIGGTELLDPADDLDLGRICPEVGRVMTVRISADGGRASCLGLGLGDLQNLRERVPAATRLSGLPNTSATSTVGQIRSVSIESGTFVTVRDSAGASVTFDPSAIAASSAGAGHGLLLAPGELHFSGVPTAVAIKDGGRTFAVGSSDGTVTELDMLSVRNFSAVGRWQLADDGPVQAIRWDSSGHIVADTAREEWTNLSCAGCFEDLAGAFAAVRARIWPCYPASAAAIYESWVRLVIGIKICAPLAAPVER